MIDNSKKDIHIIVNPAAGVRNPTRIKKYAYQEIDQYKFNVKVSYTDKSDHATLLARESLKKGCKIIVAAGGDGSVNEIAKSTVDKDAIIGIIPIGSGNGLARHLQIPTDPVKAFRIINQLKTRKIDTVKINDDIYVNIAGIGFDARIAERFAKTKRRGFIEYFKTIVSEYFKYQPQDYCLLLEKTEITTKALFICFTNSSQYGYNTIIAPEASLDDGLINICIVQKIPLSKCLYNAYLLYTKNIHKSEYVKTYQAREIQVIQRNCRLVNIDGEPEYFQGKLNIKINPLSLNVIIP